VKELTCQSEQEVTVTSSDCYQWFSFTPETSGRYILSTKDAPGYQELCLYHSPDAANSLTNTYSYWWYNHANGYDCRLSYDMTAGRTYYYRVYCGTAGTYSLFLVKEANAVSLELLTEGEIYCSSLPDYIDNSFADLAFRVTYDDGTTEDLTFGYNGTSTRYYSHQDYAMSYVEPSWEYDENHEYILDREYTVRFSYMDVSVEVPVTARSIQDMETADGTITETIAAGKYEYYKFIPETSGYYRFKAAAA
jgi:hypothetical protein